MIQITINDLLIGLIPYSVLLLAAIWLAKKLISARIDKSIQHEYDRFLEDYKYNIKIREQASKIAEYLSIVEGKRLDDNDVEFDFKHANKLAWEMLLWLPDGLYLELKKSLDLNNKDTKNNPFKVLLKIKEYLTKEKTTITDEDIFFHFPNKKQG